MTAIENRAVVVTDRIVDITVDIRVSSVGYVVILRTMESRRITNPLCHNQRMKDQQRANITVEMKIVRTNKPLCRLIEKYSRVDAYCMQNMRDAII